MQYGIYFSQFCLLHSRSCNKKILKDIPYCIRTYMITTTKKTTNDFTSENLYYHHMIQYWVAFNNFMCWVLVAYKKMCICTAECHENFVRELCVILPCSYICVQFLPRHPGKFHCYWTILIKHWNFSEKLLHTSKCPNIETFNFSWIHFMAFMLWLFRNFQFKMVPK
jgi:hypothetical protein